jgi:hypothetical protein
MDRFLNFSVVGQLAAKWQRDLNLLRRPQSPPRIATAARMSLVRSYSNRL